MECIEYAVVNGRKGVFFSLWIVQERNSLHQNQTHDMEVTQHWGIRRLYGNDVSNDLKCGWRIFTGFNTVKTEFSDGWPERDNGYSGEKDSAALSKSSVQC